MVTLWNVIKGLGVVWGSSDCNVNARQCPRALRYGSPEIRGNRDLVLAAVAQQDC